MLEKIEDKRRGWQRMRWLDSISQFSLSVMSDSLWPHGLQHTRLPCPSPTPELAQTHVHWVGDPIQPSHPLSSTSPPAFNLSQHQGLFQWVSYLHLYSIRLYFHRQSHPQLGTFCFGSVSSFFLELFLHCSPVAYWAPTNLRNSSFSVISFCLFILSVWL